MEIIESPKSFSFEVEAYAREEFEELIEMLLWLGENASTNGRVHYEFHGGAYSSGHWVRGKVIFTNDENNEDALMFKLRWCSDNP